MRRKTYDPFISNCILIEEVFHTSGEKALRIMIEMSSTKHQLNLLEEAGLFK